MDIKNLSVVRKTFANVVFTHKVHEIACERFLRYAHYIKWTNIVIIFLVLVTLCCQLIFPETTLWTFIGISLTIVEIVFLIIQLTFSFDQNALLHKNSALKYMRLRDQYTLLIADIISDALSQKELISKRNLLLDEYQIVSEMSPQTNDDDYNETQMELNKKGVVKGEDFTWTEVEIDRFLPKELKLLDDTPI